MYGWNKIIWRFMAVWKFVVKFCGLAVSGGKTSCKS